MGANRLIDWSENENFWKKHLIFLKFLLNLMMIV